MKEVKNAFKDANKKKENSRNNSKGVSRDAMGEEEIRESLRKKGLRACF
jgi:hypothetical protein